MLEVECHPAKGYQSLMRMKVWKEVVADPIGPINEAASPVDTMG